MNASTSTSVPAPPVQSASPTDRTRRWAAVAALLFVPAVVATAVSTLTSERAGRCLTYGEQCTPALPGWLFAWSAGVGAVAFLIAVAAPALRVRQAALVAQFLAEGTALLVILSHA
ncbi:hypothetical protein [Streptomyces sp. NBC_01334]|uniref:hypothetical protein n=1 Tax=Streptomyces sp. NBC_01334 TaxID=2903827 RepID=UPI002E0F448C|nr:hypothetical protein OG736_34445 [Streptomyces sp. NBC_01334]